MHLRDLRECHRRAERELVRNALERTDSLTAAARELGIAVSSLQAAINSYGLSDWYQERSRPRGRPRQQ